jgi:hypothetical protein
MMLVSPVMFMIGDTNPEAEAEHAAIQAEADGLGGGMG